MADRTNCKRPLLKDGSMRVLSAKAVENPKFDSLNLAINYNIELNLTNSSTKLNDFQGESCEV
jgi:hypothetical protein